MSEAFKSLRGAAQAKWADLESGGKPWVRVGTAICGRAAGAEEVLDALRRELARRGIDANVHEVGCLGLCYAEPLVDVKLPGGPRVFYGNVTPDMVPGLVDACLVSGNPSFGGALASLGDGAVDGVPRLEDADVWRSQVRIATRNCGSVDPGDVEHYLAQGGYGALERALSSMSPQDLMDEVTKAGLRGRGGAAFPTGTKWSFLARTPGDVKYVLVNCEEGDPGAFNDKGLLESDPHTVVEGTILAGYATGATFGYIFIRHGHEGPIDRTRRAIEQARQARLLGKSIRGSDFSFDMEVALTGESYVSGEETALMEAIEGKRAMPRARPPFPAQVGLWGKPSNINNVKTLAYVPEIISRGSDWFASIGYGRSKGTAITCLSGDITRPGMYEVPFGMTIGQIIDDVAGGVPGGGSVKLLQTGGPLGGVLGPDSLGITLDFESMAAAGASLGSGGIIVGGQRVCVVDLVRNLVAFCQFESCGKCFPCRLGTTHLLDTLDRIASMRGRPEDLALMESMGQALTLGSLCGHGQLGFNPVSSAIRYFGGEFRAHIQDHRCPTGRCYGPFFKPSRTRPLASGSWYAERDYAHS